MKDLRYGELSKLLGERTALPPSFPDDVLDQMAALGVDVEAIQAQVSR